LEGVVKEKKNSWVRGNTPKRLGGCVNATPNQTTNGSKAGKTKNEMFVSCTREKEKWEVSKEGS